MEMTKILLQVQLHLSCSPNFMHSSVSVPAIVDLQTVKMEEMFAS